MNTWETRRRDLLKSLGVGMGWLPLLRASNLWAAGATTPKRLIISMNTNGWRQQWWKPTTGSLMTQQLLDTPSALEPHKADLIFCPDMTQPAYPGGGGGHGVYVNILASGANDNKGEYRVPLTPTIDQIVGPQLAEGAGLSRISLPLGLQVAGGDAGIFPSKRMCWKDRNTPITPEEDIYRAYADVFAGGTAQANLDAVRSLMAHKKSILDYAGHSLERFKGRLGTDDRQVVESHLQSVRALETELASPRTDLGKCGTDPGAPIDVKLASNYPTLMKLSMDLMVAALRCDVTRIATLANADASGSNISFSWVPEVKRGWHSIGHNPTGGGVEVKRFADKWLHNQFATLLDRLKAVPEPGGTMLDNTIVVWANHMEEGHTHNSQKTPWILAGNITTNGKRYFRTGQCAPTGGKPVNGVLYHICHALGVPVPYFGTQSFGGPMDGLTT